MYETSAAERFSGFKDTKRVCVGTLEQLLEHLSLRHKDTEHNVHTERERSTESTE